VSFSAAGSLQNGENSVAATSTTFSLTTVTVGDFILASVANDSNIAASNVSSTKATWTQFTPASGALSFTNGQAINHWIGKVTSTGADTVTVTFASSMGGGNSRFDAREFSSTSGNAFLDTSGTVNGTGTASWATLTPAGSGELYWGWCENSGSATGGSTSGFVYEPDAHANGAGYCLSVSAAYTPVWGDSGQVAGIMVLVTETGGTPPADLPGIPAQNPLLAWPFQQRR
jgi:hypothetical protein